MLPRQFVAVDWSGRKAGERKAIWSARLSDGEIELSSGRTRPETIRYLLSLLEEQRLTVAGLDFAFGFPGWFVKSLGLRDGGAAMDRLDHAYCEAILAGSHHGDLFWGRRNQPRRPERLHPEKRLDLRETERACRIGSARPKSVFQIAGSGSVGTGSLRGIPYLRELRAGGYAVWPFDEATLPLAVEIYPRVLTGAVQKSRAAAREAYVKSREDADLPAQVLRDAIASEDAFDALISVLEMQRHAASFAALERAHPELSRLEGEIWKPERLVD